MCKSVDYLSRRDWSGKARLKIMRSGFQSWIRRLSNYINRRSDTKMNSLTSGNR